MDFKKFAYNSVIRNFKSYLGYYLSSTISIMIFFAFAVSVFHPNVTSIGIQQGSTLFISLMTTEFVIILVSMLFIVYSLGSFMKSRFKEFGTLKIIGISDIQFKKLIFLEGIIIGGLSILSGIILGFIFAKPFLTLTSSIFEINATTMYIPIKAILITIVVFTVLFSVASPFTILVIKSKTIIELLNGSKKPKAEPKNSMFLALMSIVILATGYVGSLIVINEYIVIGCVMLGTYLFFSQFTILTLNLIKKNKQYYMRKTNILWVSDLVYKVRDNSRLLFLTSILLSGTLVSVSALSTIVDSQLDDVKSEYPYVLTYTSSKDNKVEKEQIKIIEDELNKGGYVYDKSSFNVLDLENKGRYILKESDFNNLGEKLKIENIRLNNNEALIIPRYTDSKYQKGLKDIKTLEVGSKNLKVKGISSKKIIPAGYMKTFMVVNDNLYLKLEKDSNNTEYIINGYNYDNWEKSYETAIKIQNGIDRTSKNNFDKGEYYDFFDNLPQMYKGEVQLNKSLLFIGTFIGIIFFICSCSFLYFRFYTDSISDKEKYKSLSKIGLSYAEMKKTLNVEIGSMFFIPYMIALLNAIFSVLMLSSMKCINLGLKGIIVTFIFFAIYFVYFIVLKSKYIKEIAKEIPGYLD